MFVFISLLVYTILITVFYCEHSLKFEVPLIGVFRYGGGVEVEVWSNLPQGSGLGGSSLLAGTLVAGVAVLLGHPLPSHSHLIHATLCIEQWLTTGGGWQDQVCSLCSPSASFPLLSHTY